MVCPQCSYENPDSLTQCQRCQTPLPFSGETLATGGQGWSLPVGDVVVSSPSLVQLAPCTTIGGRYEITRLLGQGGMGSVYLAYDRELDRQVALKVIRGEMASDPEI